MVRDFGLSQLDTTSDS